MIRAFNVPIPESGAGKKLGGIYIDDVREFFESGARNAELEWDKKQNKDIQSVQSYYGVAIKRCGYSGVIGTKRRGDRLFLVRKDRAL